MKIKQFMKLALVGSMAAASIGALASCGSKVPEGYTGFLADADLEVVLGETLDLNTYVDYVQWDDLTEAWANSLYNPDLEYADYELTLSKGEKVLKLSGRDSYDLDDSVEPGDWTLTYTISEKKCDYKGTFTTTIKIAAPALQVGMTLNDTNNIRYYGTTMNYEDLFNDVNMDVKSYYDYTATLSQVVIGTETVDLANTTSYRFTNLGKHTFTLSIVAEDGQSYTQTMDLNVVYRDVYNASILLFADEATGDYKIPLTETVSNVMLNGTAIAADKVTIAADGITIDKDMLYANPGANVVSFEVASGEIQAANVQVYTDAVVDYEDGVNSTVVGYGRYSQNGADGKVSIVENVGKDGNAAIKGVTNDGGVTNLMNVNFNTYFLETIFKNGSADYFTFDMLCDLPYLRFVREGGGYYNESGTLVKPGNTYIVADANDVGFQEYTEQVGNLYRFSLVFPKAAWNKMSVNGTKTAEEILATVAFDFSAAVDLVTPNGNKFTQTTQNITEFYIDNIRVGKYNSADMTFADGVNTGNFNLCNAAWGSTSIVAFGNDYALEHTTKTETANSETTAFRVYTEYLHEVFNVAGASALTFKVYVDPEKVDAVKFAFFLSDGTNKVKTDEFTVSAFDTTTKSYTVTITKELYSKYYDANGNGIEATLGATKALVPCLWMNLTKGGATTGFATVVTFDDFVKVMPQA